MKNIIIILVILSSTILLTGCSDTNQNNNIQKITYSTIQEQNINQDPKEDISNNIISSFYTKIYDTHINRMNNLRIGADKLHGQIVKSGETFSFNKRIGPYSRNKGYLKAKIFSSTGNVYNEYGGGICQISTTLYNAVKDLNVEIIERHTHSKKVQYIENGKDATLSYDRLDFKFTNNLPYPILIESYVDKNNVYVNIKKEEQ